MWIVLFAANLDGKKFKAMMVILHSISSATLIVDCESENMTIQQIRGKGFACMQQTNFVGRDIAKKSKKRNKSKETCFPMYYFPIY